MLPSRMERVQSLIKHEVGQIIDRELKNPNLPKFITIFKVKVSKDLSHALVLITFLEDQTPQIIERTVKELNHSAGYISRLLAQRIRLRRHPSLKFAYNASTHYALDMEHIFQQIKQEEESKPHQDEENLANCENDPQDA